MPIADESDAEAKKYVESFILREILKNEAIPEELREKIRNKKAKILDIGTGKGLAVDFLLEEGYQACGIDYQNLNPEKTENKIIADAAQVPFADNTFDIIMSIGGIDPVFYRDQTPEKMEEIESEIKRILKDPGVFVSPSALKEMPTFGEADSIRILSKYVALKTTKK